ncbi:MAG: hypothetical protein HOM37_02345 [Acidimicrobiaceae bacterium]|nr:hypothetical protein [Acidimicrobiaceae bacterium]
MVHGVARESRLLVNVIHDQELPIEPWVGGPKTRHLRVTPLKITGRAIPGPESAIMEEKAEA